MNSWRTRKPWLPMAQLSAPKGSCVFHMRRLWIGWRKGLRESGEWPKGSFNGFLFPLGEDLGFGHVMREETPLGVQCLWIMSPNRLKHSTTTWLFQKGIVLEMR